MNEPHDRSAVDLASILKSIGEIRDGVEVIRRSAEENRTRSTEISVAGALMTDSIAQVSDLVASFQELLDGTIEFATSLDDDAKFEGIRDEMSSIRAMLDELKQGQGNSGGVDELKVAMIDLLDEIRDMQGFMSGIMKSVDEMRREVKQELAAALVQITSIRLEVTDQLRIIRSEVLEVKDSLAQRRGRFGRS